MLAAVKQEGEALQFASKKLKNNDEIIKIANLSMEYTAELKTLKKLVNNEQMLPRIKKKTAALIDAADHLKQSVSLEKLTQFLTDTSTLLQAKQTNSIEKKLTQLLANIKRLAQDNMSMPIQDAPQNKSSISIGFFSKNSQTSFSVDPVISLSESKSSLDTA